MPASFMASSMIVAMATWNSAFSLGERDSIAFSMEALSASPEDASILGPPPQPARVIATSTHASRALALFIY